MYKHTFRRTLSAFLLVTLTSLGSVALAGDYDMPHHGGYGMGHMDGMGMMGKGHSHGHHMGHQHNWNRDFMGMGSGYMTARLGRLWRLHLTPDEKKKIRVIERQLRATVWKHRDAIEDISDELFELYGKPHRDAAAIGKVYGKIFDQKRQIIEAQIEAGNKAEDVLTSKQREILKHWRSKDKMMGGSWEE